MRKLLTTPQREVKELPAGREVKGLLGPSLINRKYSERIHEYSSPGVSAIRLPGKGAGRFHLPEGEPVGLFDADTAMRLLESMNRFSGRNYQEFEGWFNNTLQVLDDLLGSEKQAENILAELMTVLGFENRGKDWAITRDHHVKIKNLNSLKTTYLFHKDYPDILRNYLSDISYYRKNIKEIERKMKKARKETLRTTTV